MMASLMFALAAWALPATLWWAAHGFPTARPAGRHRTEVPGRDPRHRAVVSSVDDDTRFAALTRQGVSWADPTMVWPALSVENALLSELLAGRLRPDYYRERMTDLARRCEPAEPASGEE
ncbi:hypothetical protein ACWDUL_16345 [Nocardia niigatensis]|uniref:hypothetical protein n=1 Tax=Nocardia niigatensis TaxID=209249 RepID=UPI0012F6DCA7|nr:hypothetical protein [Nocardia niigatensis]